jgi:hypothetical protein
VRAEALAGLARASAAAHRLAMGGRGGLVLARFAEGFAAFAEREPARAAALGPLLAAITTAQARGDALGLADLLEHELAPALDAAR